MPSVTLTVDSGEADRIQAALSATPYPQTIAGVKQLLIDYINSLVKSYEKAQGETAALAGIASPAEGVIS